MRTPSEHVDKDLLSKSTPRKYAKDLTTLNDSVTMDCNGGNTKTLISEDKFYKIIDMHDADEKRLKPMTQITIDTH